MWNRLNYGLAGLQTGITGAIAMMIFLALGSLLTRHSIWWMPNLIASSVYGQSSVREGIGFPTAAGTAMTLCFYGAMGIAFGEFAGGRRGGIRFFWISLIAGMLIYWCLLRWFWRLANPIGHLYASDGQLLFAHLLFGCFLAAYPRAQRRLSQVPIG
jgi:hypothetical protein